MTTTITALLFGVVLFSSLAVLSHLTRKRIIEPTLQAGRARRSPIAEFVDDLEKHRWLVIILLALLVALDKYFGFSHGLLQSRLTLAVCITLLFAGRLLMRRSARP